LFLVSFCFVFIRQFSYSYKSLSLYFLFMASQRFNFSQILFLGTKEDILQNRFVLLPLGKTRGIVIIMHLMQTTTTPPCRGVAPPYAALVKLVRTFLSFNWAIGIGTWTWHAFITSFCQHKCYVKLHTTANYVCLNNQSKPGLVFRSSKQFLVTSKENLLSNQS